MLIKFKKNIKKIPVVSGLAKLVYDWRQEKKLRKKVDDFLAAGSLPHTNIAPPQYIVGYEPTIRCNLKCKMCYQGQTRALRRNELNTSEVIEIFEKLRKKTAAIKLVGGEPMVRDDILELLNFWHKSNTRTILQTNCTLIGVNNVKTIKQLTNITDVLTSLDGPPELHDSIRGVPGAFDKLKQAIELLEENRPDIPVTVFATILPWDNLDNLLRLIDVAKGLKLETLNLIFEQVYSAEEIKAAQNVFTNVFGWLENSYRLNTQSREKLFPDGFDAPKFKKKLREARFYGLKKRCFINFVPFNYYRQPAKYLNGGPGRPFCLKLLAPELRINQTGDVIWCDVIEKSFGNLLEKTPDQIWLSDEYQKFRDYLYRKSLPICRRCCKAMYV
jgi:MoaA/NifB/PqqE/SkfB family radical SAM enzyme